MDKTTDFVQLNNNQFNSDTIKNFSPAVTLQEKVRWVS